MKKILGVLLGLCLVLPAVMAAGVSDIDKNVWLNYISEMNVLRKQIVETKKEANLSVEKQEKLSELMAKFEAKQLEWDEYLKAVANDDECGRAKLESDFKKGRVFRKKHDNKNYRHKCCKFGKKSDKAELKCDKTGKNCDRVGKKHCKTQQKCDKAELKCDRTGKNCDKAGKKCYKTQQKCDKAERKLCCKSGVCNKYGECDKAGKKCCKEGKCAK